MQIQLVFGHHSHGSEVRIYDWHVQNSVEAVDPEISLFDGWSEKQEVSTVSFQLETVLPRRLTTIDLCDSCDSLDAYNLSFENGLVLLCDWLFLHLYEVLFGRDDYISLVEI